MKCREVKDLEKIQSKQLTENARKSMSAKNLNLDYVQMKKSKTEQGDTNAWTYEYWVSDSQIHPEKARKELQDLAIWMEQRGLLCFKWLEKGSPTWLEHEIREKFGADEDPVKRLREANDLEQSQKLIDHFESLRDSTSYRHDEIGFDDGEGVQGEISLSLWERIRGKFTQIFTPLVDSGVLFGTMWQANDIYRFIVQRNKERSAYWCCAFCGYRCNDPEGVYNHGAGEHEGFHHEDHVREFVGDVRTVLLSEEELEERGEA